MKMQAKNLCALLLLFTAASLPAQTAPEYINYQGLLKAADGTPLATGNYTMEFNVYDNANAGNKVWGPFFFDGYPGTDGHGLTVSVANGSFNVILGPRDTSGASIRDAFSGPDRFIEIKVNDGAPILPRQQFLSTAYAFQSQKAQLADVASALVQQMADTLCPPGSIIAFGGTNIPAGWLLCDGRSLALTNPAYSRLYAAIGTAWGGAAGSFNLPDLRGVFLRGVNGTRADSYTDPDATSRSAQATGGNINNLPGSFQAGKYQMHFHKWAVTDNTTDIFSRALWSWKSDGTGAKVVAPRTAGGSGSGGDDDWMWVTEQNTTFWTEAVANAPGETRPHNAYVHYIIKY